MSISANPKSLCRALAAGVAACFLTTAAPQGASAAFEGFEDGEISWSSWSYGHGGSDSWRWWVPAGEWQRTNRTVHSGLFSARAAAVRHNEASALSVTVDVSHPGNVSFFAKVSSERNYDFLIFYVNGEEKGRWSGAVAEPLTFRVGSGQTTFSWVYRKDYSVNAGEDTAWIDDVEFPPLVGEGAPWWWWFGIYGYITSAFEGLSGAPVAHLRDHDVCQDDASAGWVVQKHGQAIVDGIAAAGTDEQRAGRLFADAVRELGRFANSLRCLDQDGLRYWDRTIGRFLGDVATGRLSIPGLSQCDAVHAMWNPALIVVDWVQLTGDSEIVGVFRDNAATLRRCMQSFPVDSYGAAQLEDFGRGTLVRARGASARDNLLETLVHPENLGLGLCSMLGHTTNASCLAGLAGAPEMCESGGEGIVGAMRSAGLTSFRAQATFFNGNQIVASGQPYTGWYTTVTEDYPREYFGTPTEQLPGMIDLGQTLCRSGTSGGNLGGGGGLGLPSGMSGCMFDMLGMGWRGPADRIIQCHRDNTPTIPYAPSPVAIQVPVGNCEAGNPEDGDGAVNEEAVEAAVNEFLDGATGEDSGSSDPDTTLSEETRQNLQRAESLVNDESGSMTNDIAERFGVDPDSVDSAVDFGAGARGTNPDGGGALQKIAESSDLLRAAMEVGGVPVTDDIGVWFEKDGDKKYVIIKGSFMPTPDGAGGCPQSPAEARAEAMFECMHGEEVTAASPPSPDPWIYPTGPSSEMPASCNELDTRMFFSSTGGGVINPGWDSADGGGFPVFEIPIVGYIDPAPHWQLQHSLVDVRSAAELGVVTPDPGGYGGGSCCVTCP